jgi:putative transposase
VVLSLPAFDRDSNLIDAMLSEQRDMTAAKAFFRAARAAMGFRPDRVTTDGHGSNPRAIRSVPGRTVRHRTSMYLNNRLEQDHRGIKGRIRCVRGFKSAATSRSRCATPRRDAAERHGRPAEPLGKLHRPAASRGDRYP